MFNALIRMLLAPLSRFLYQPRITGVDKVPVDGPVIFAANHLSAVDTAVIALWSPRAVQFLSKDEYFTKPGIKGRMMAKFLTAMGFVPVNRDSAHAALASLTVMSNILSDGGAVGIYPEGTRSLDGKLHRGHTGVASLALSTRAPVVPVALSGTDKVQPKGTTIPRLAKVSVTFGQPLYFDRYDGMEASPAIRRAITDEIMYAILELSDQDYDDRYHKRPSQAA